MQPRLCRTDRLRLRRPMCGGGFAPPEADIPTKLGLCPEDWGGAPQIESNHFGRAQPFLTSGGIAANERYRELSL
jgi:hypothetical protein